jgi:3D (Asp-Asp-Asp) domain-containing protein
MSYRPSGTQNLPVVMYAPGGCFPGASHAAPPGRPRAHPAARLPYGEPLLALAAASLVALAALRHRAPPAAALPAPVRIAALPAAVRPARSTVPRAPRWDTRLSATPRPGQFVRFFRMKATAYTPINTRMEGGRYTVTWRDGRAAHGVAVDPGLIPLGSRLWIPGYGHAVADDIGGRIQGHHVDIRVQVYGHMGRWGVRPVRVYVLQEPKP